MIYIIIIEQKEKIMYVSAQNHPSSCKRKYFVAIKLIQCYNNVKNEISI